MSRIGRKPISIPEGVSVTVKDGLVEVKKGNVVLKDKIHPSIDMKIADNQVSLEPKKGKEDFSNFWGLARTQVANLIEGVSKGFTKKLEFNGVGYRIKVEGSKKVVLEVGFSHPVELAIPETVSVKVVKNTIEVSGPDKRMVGQFSAELRGIKPPEPYKGKGIKYADEHIVRKEGKKAAGEEASAK